MTDRSFVEETCRNAKSLQSKSNKDSTSLGQPLPDMESFYTRYRTVVGHAFRCRLEETEW